MKNEVIPSKTYRQLHKRFRSRTKNAFIATLENMAELADVTDLDAVRARKRDAASTNAWASADRTQTIDGKDPEVTLSRLPLTVLVEMSNVRADEEVHRDVGVNDAMSFEELHRVIEICFDLPDERVPWHFFKCKDGQRAERIDPQRQISEVLWEERSRVEYMWGLWEFTIEVTEIYPRDGGSPQALCIGGSNSFPGSDFDLTTINSALTGQDAIDEALQLVKDPVHSLIERSMLFDFVPLVQAMDLAREVELDADKKVVIAKLPLEDTEIGRDAFWSTILALTCLSGKELTEEVMTTTMDALGWEQDNGESYTADQIREMCSDSLAKLEEIGGTGKKALPPVYRLEVFREILGRHEP